MSGRLILMGSGELSPTMVATHRRGLDEAGTSRVTVLDTPFGFQENAEELTARIARYFRTSLQADVDVARLRRADGPLSRRARALAKIATGRYLFSGPGSPSYALAVWKASGVGEALAARLRAGATIALASAAAVTVGRMALPVYEIYKVGADPHWLAGLDLTGSLGLPMVVVPHWNNAEGGTHDTSRCFIGRRRFELLADRLDVGVVGVDEHTAATFDFRRGTVEVTGVGTVTLRGREETLLAAGEALPLEEVRRLLGGTAPAPPSRTETLGPPAADGDPDEPADRLLSLLEEAVAGSTSARRAVEQGIVELAEQARRGRRDPRDLIAGYIEVALEGREALRSEGRWEEADRIRDRLAQLGVEVRDQPEGVEWHLVGEDRARGDFGPET